MALSFAAMLVAGAATAEGSGGLKATLSLPFGDCSSVSNPIAMVVTWHHPKPGQDHVTMQVFDTTTEHFSLPFTSFVGPASTAADHSFAASSGGPDVWIAKAFLEDSSNTILAQTTSKRYTFDCTL